MKKMSEREAWLWLAKEWDDAQESFGFYAVTIDRHFQYGLCPCIEQLLETEKIGRVVARRMKEKISARVRRRSITIKGHRYMTRPNAAGAKIRAKFCRQQEENLQC